MKKILFLAALLSFLSGRPQGNPDYTMLASVCEAWGLIKYFHPDMPGARFDSAFAARVPAMLKAGNEKEWREALSGWLDVLDDPLTAVVADGEFADDQGFLKSEFLPDSTLLITLRGKAYFGDPESALRFLQQAMTLIPLAHAVIFDLRQDNPHSPDLTGLTDFLFDKAGLSQRYGSDLVPQYRSVYRSGFKTEGEGSGFYEINSVLTPGMVAGGADPKPFAWIINRYSDMPSVALTQQAGRTALLFSDGIEPDDLLPLSYRYDFPGGMAISYRNARLIMPDGRKAAADVIYNSSEDPVKLAVKLLDGKAGPKHSEDRDLRLFPASEPAVYPGGAYPAVGYRLLAAAKMYTVIRLFFPYCQFMDRDWHDVLVESLPGIIEAADSVDYGLAVAKMYANIQDSHGFMSGNKGLEKLAGQAPSPVYVDWVENRIAVIRLRSDSLCRSLGIAVGDVILELNGTPVETLMEPFFTYFAHSTPQAIQTTAARQCIRGPEGGLGTFTIQDMDGKRKKVNFTWSNSYNKNFKANDFRLDTLAMLQGNIGYADLRRMVVSQTDTMFSMFRNTRAIIFDMRGYPNGTAWSVAPRLTDKRDVPVALFRRNEVKRPYTTQGEDSDPRMYSEMKQIMAVSPQWKYQGKTVMLTDQNTISQAEHTGLIFRALANTTFIGSPTMGANGDVTVFMIPGGISMGFSGQGVWWPNGDQLQRKGIQPDVTATPTISGLAEGRDEVLEKAIRWINENIK